MSIDHIDGAAVSDVLEFGANTDFIVSNIDDITEKFGPEDGYYKSGDRRALAVASFVIKELRTDPDNLSFPHQLADWRREVTDQCEEKYEDVRGEMGSSMTRQELNRQADVATLNSVRRGIGIAMRRSLRINSDISPNKKVQRRMNQRPVS